ncbi:MAG: hypothetical protein JSW72_01855 [Candidatus Bathyarchaeota archaeon]|nr:MAG: hypothetical protein JSW72_01855 [Candidatus Bathyarchaeota archaeon]
MYLRLFLGINVVVFVALCIYDILVGDIRQSFLAETREERFLSFVDSSTEGVIGLLSFSSVVFSIWAGFGFTASTEMKQLYGEDIFIILVTCALAILLYGLTMYAYHLSQYIKFKKTDIKKEKTYRQEIFMRGETFFIFGTAYFLLTCLYSLITMASVLAPSTDCLYASIAFFVVALVALAILTGRKLWKILMDLRVTATN